MPSSDKEKQGAKVEVLAEKLRKLYVQVGETLDELDAVLADQPTMGQQAKWILTSFASLWNKTYPGRKYIIDWPKEITQAKRLLKTLEAAEVITRAELFFVSSDPYYRQALHPFSLFVKAINKFQVNRGGDDGDDFLQAPAVDCRHNPRCRSDQEHTRRKLQDARR